MIDQKQLNECLVYIDSYWSRIIHQPKDSRQDPHLIPLPHPYVSPNDTSHWLASLFYWDTYFIFRGMVATKHEWIMPNVVANFSYLLKKYGIIPNATVWAFLGHSQPPFLSSMVFDGYYAIKRSGGVRGMVKKQFANFWLSHYMKVAKKEYEHVWENNESYYHKVEEYGLSRYGDRDVGYALTSERESGWDFTTRFYNRCNDFLPVDLNSYLHKYEKDFARAANILRRRKDEAYWEEKAQMRHDRMKKLMWNPQEGFFFDYDYVNKLQSKYFSLAGFVPMWANLATYNEAKQMVKKLSLFETTHGLTITSKSSMPPSLDLHTIPKEYRLSMEEVLAPKQWDYPNIWAPLEYLTVIGLIRYGFVDHAVRIMEKSINANLQIFSKYGALLEKIDSETLDKPKKYWYPTQLGFGWTNAIFFRYVQILKYIEQMNGNIYGSQPTDSQPPYDITNILH